MDAPGNGAPAAPPRAAAARGAPDGCQLAELSEVATPLALEDHLRQRFLRLPTAARRRLERVVRLVAPPPRAAPAPPGPTAVVPDFVAGERVRVLPLERLRPLLDAEGQTRGLTFRDGMERYCGRELTVKRKVRTIFDERHGRMVRLRRTYLLEGAICDSRGRGDREGCDRCCYYFWRRIWLERVE